MSKGEGAVARSLQGSAKSLRPITSFLLNGAMALNLAWLVVWYQRAVGSPWLHIRHPQRFEPISAEEQIVWSLTLAMIFFVALQIVARRPSHRRALLLISGLVSLVGFPGLALYEPGFFNQPPEWHYRIPSIWLSIEAAAALILGALAAERQRRLRMPLMTILLLAHFSFWAWLTGSYVSFEMERYYFSRGVFDLRAWVPNIFFFGFPVIGFVSSLSWALNVRRATGIRA